jgi:hypothetical protein
MKTACIGLLLFVASWLSSDHRDAFNAPTLPGGSATNRTITRCITCDGCASGLSEDGNLPPGMYSAFPTAFGGTDGTCLHGHALEPPHVDICIPAPCLFSGTTTLTIYGILPTDTITPLFGLPGDIAWGTPTFNGATGTMELRADFYDDQMASLDCGTEEDTTAPIWGIRVVRGGTTYVATISFLCTQCKKS